MISYQSLLLSTIVLNNNNSEHHCAATVSLLTSCTQFFKYGVNATSDVIII